ncbi:MATE family efflux transporter [Legionella clemsonensis]|uniref:Polysaccharide biosynthesis protein n=1 Tax=Legionella clemsonensis TaxID=1867846 RepID=A0A222P5N0_9GAMM|nr:hypothetical protein [Legionella clemsonensis]ASQ47085.1 Polysaccharide biosynthesis protein [Legionella clemsonensis]
MTFTINLLLIMANQCMLFLINLMVARNAGTSAFGDFTVAVNALFLIGTIATMGLDSIIAHYIPKYFVRRKHNDIHALTLSIKNFLRPIYLTIFSGGLLISLAIIALSYSLEHIQLYDISHLVTLFLWGAVVLSIYNIYIQLFRAVGYMRTAVILGLLQTLLYFLFTLFTYFYFHDILFHNNAKYFAHIMLISFILSYVLIGLAFILIHYKTQLKLNITVSKLHKTGIAWREKMYGYTIQSLDKYAFTVVPLLITEWLGRDEYIVGLFSAVASIIALGFTALSPIGILIKPEISAAFAHGKEFLFKTVRKYIGICLATAFIVVPILGVFTQRILLLFKSDFIEALPYVYVALINLFCYAISMPLSHMIQYSREGSKIGAKLTIYILLLQIIACMILIPWLGLLGAIICYIGISIVNLIAAFTTAYRIYQRESFDHHR